MDRLVAVDASGPRLARAATTSSARRSKSPAGTSSETSPHSSAVGPSSFSPVRASLMARARPMLAATSAVAPPSGIRAIRAKASTKDAASEAST